MTVPTLLGVDFHRLPQPYETRASSSPVCHLRPVFFFTLLSVFDDVIISFRCSSAAAAAAAAASHLSKWEHSISKRASPASLTWTAASVRGEI